MMKHKIAYVLIFCSTTVLFAAPADDYVITVKTDNPGVSNNNEFTIPITRTSGNGYNVDCNNDGIDEATGITGNSDYTCVYGSAGTYTIRVKDNNNADRKGFRRIRFYVNSSTQTDAEKLIEINQWGTEVWSSMASAYRGAVNVTSTPTDIPELSEVSSLRAMFQGCTNADIKTAGWDISNITNLSYMFRNAASANPDVSGWNTANVTRMDAMFWGATQVNPDVSGWDTANVTKMNNMFRNAVNATPDVSGWNTANVTTMYGMFYGASSATPVTTTNGNIWNTSSVTSFAYMFQDAPLATPDTGGWNTSSATTMRAMFKNASAANPSTSGWNTSNVTTMQAMFRGAASANPDVANWDVSQVTSMLSMFNGATHANPDVTNWDVSSVTTMASMFQNAVAFDRNLQYWDVSNVTNFINFLTGAKLSTYNYDALLKAWQNLTLSSDERFDAGNSTYCDGETARQNIIDTYNWDIRDAGKHCPAPCEEVERHLSAMQWTLISIPCDTGSNGVEALMGNALGTYGDNADWVMYEQTGADDYIGTNTQKRMLDSTDTVQPGKGYWIISAQDANLTIDTTLGGLNYTAVQPASNLGISSSVFDDLNLTRLPDSDSANSKKIMMGNPFPKKMQLSDIYFSHGGTSGSYNPMSTDSNSPNAPYIKPTVYTYEHTGTSNTNYVAITPDTPGFTDRIDPMVGFWILLKSGQTGSNYLTFPYEK